MIVRYAFVFDAKYCTGCKACQAACKDKNDLPPGVLWRRVLEISGGTWTKEGPAWTQTVAAYNLSLSCNHCLHPKCAGICPTNAYTVRGDGIVVLDESRCMGCGYCAWACPYGAPQYNAERGTMGKCDLCIDNLEKGLPPACVAACPLRALDYDEVTAPPMGREVHLWEAPPETHPYPLPDYSHTQPRLAISRHPAMRAVVEKSLANLEEIRPRIPSAWEEVPLLLYTLLSQMAVGGVWALAWMFPPIWMLPHPDISMLQLLPSLLIGGCLSAGMLASLAHLGSKRNIPHVFSNLRRSWLSREVLYTGLFGLAWLMMILQGVIHQRYLMEWITVSGIAGLGLIYSMAQVYRLPAAPGWNTWRTPAGFLVSALLLGITLLTPLLGYESLLTGIGIPSSQAFSIYLLAALLLMAQLALEGRRSSTGWIRRLRKGFLFAGIAMVFFNLLSGAGIRATSSLLFSLLVFAEEGLGRWSFYRDRLEQGYARKLRSKGYPESPQSSR